ncbi:putative 5' exonuclease Apollo [Paratrimastix pyriformis]|uniref:5' exonuclease Apollo n=1 Tax=Paratrimastix pyriformis TaxID=342808 RepID=A0ABQ8UNX9_9EUKA|nr:putative 5' exonuclease Apollo [Paratrimastix pyriformis]
MGFRIHLLLWYYKIFGCWLQIVPGVSLLPIDANHVPGSLLFLFDGFFGRIMHTGDFRFDPALHCLPCLQGVDTLYLDNTYCNPRHQHPPRAALRGPLRDLIRRHMERFDVVVALTHFGKEDMLQWLADELQCLVAVSERRMGYLEAMRWPTDRFTTDPTQAAIRTIVRSDEQWSAPALRLAASPPPAIGEEEAGTSATASSGETPTIVIMLSAWQPPGLSGPPMASDEQDSGPADAPPRERAARHAARSGPHWDLWADLGRTCTMESSPTERRFHVPYSDHSNFAELAQFVEWVRPGRVLGIVPTGGPSAGQAALNSPPPGSDPPNPTQQPPLFAGVEYAPVTHFVHLLDPGPPKAPCPCPPAHGEVPPRWLGPLTRVPARAEEAALPRKRPGPGRRRASASASAEELAVQGSRFATAPRSDALPTTPPRPDIAGLLSPHSGARFLGDADEAEGQDGAGRGSDDDEALRALTSLSARARHRQGLAESGDVTESGAVEEQQRGETPAAEGERNPSPLRRLGPHQGPGGCAERPIELE